MPTWFSLVRGASFVGCVAFFAWRVAVSAGEWSKGEVGTAVGAQPAGERPGEVPSVAVCRRKVRAKLIKIANSCKRSLN